MIEKISSFIEYKLAPLNLKMSQNRYLNAIKDSILTATPFLMAGSFIFMILHLPFTDKNGSFYIEWYDMLLKNHLAGFIQMFNFSMGILSIFIAFGVGYHLSNYYKLNNVTGGFLSIYSFLLIASKMNNSAIMKAVNFFNKSENNIIDARFLDGSGMFLAIITAIISIEIYRLLLNRKIKLPEQIPPAISDSFGVIMPIMVIGILFNGLGIIIEKNLSILIPELILKISAPILKFSNSLPFLILILLLVHLLWFCGIHGSGALNSIIGMITISNLALNQTALQSGDIMTGIIAGEFFNIYIYIGGAGATLGLSIAMLMSKNEHIKSIGRLSVIPGIFNINETVIFGTPIIMNPMMFIPFVSVPIINGTIAYTVLKMGIVEKMIAITSWTTPSPIGAFISSNFSISAVILSISLIILSFLIYTPFLKAYEKSLNNQNN